ncbi:MAG: hypothetical protein VZQ47_05515 [Treponema sp.]|nr:hypothetical protein [Treponema sp.]MEE3434992.1 hypothetical protein [Treponema sp.]
MDDVVKLAKEISREHDKTTIIVLAIMLIVYIISNYLIPCFLSSANRKNEIIKIKIERKLDCIENLIKQLKHVSSFLSVTDKVNIDGGKKIIGFLRKDIQENYFLLTKDFSKTANELLDYFSVVLLSPGKRKLNIENRFFLKLKTEYEKLI